MQLKEKFLNAVISGELGKVDGRGHIVKLKEFKNYFRDIKTDYINSFLPAATIEIGQHSMSHTKYLFRIERGTYRVHPDAIEEQILKNKQNNNLIKEPQLHYTSNTIIKQALTIRSS